MVRRNDSGVVQARGDWHGDGAARTSIRQVVVRRCCPSSTSTVSSDLATVALAGRGLGSEAVAMVGFVATQMRPTLCPAWKGGSLSWEGRHASQRPKGGMRRED